MAVAGVVWVAGCSAGGAAAGPLVAAADRLAVWENMGRDALDAFVRRDADTARRLCRRDDEVDNLNRQVFRELLSYMVESPAAITRAMGGPLRRIWLANAWISSGKAPSG